MRKDMHKVIIETGRTGGYGKYKGKEKFDYYDIEDIPPGGKVGIKFPYRNNKKSQNDKLSPIRRYLRSQIGRPWNDVYSEICKTFRGNGVLQEHIRRHILEDLIETKTRMVDGEIWVFEDTPHKLNNTFQIFSNEGTLYVHPETGLVSIHYATKSRKKQREEREKKRAEAVKEVGYMQLAINLNGLWYLVQLEDLPTDYEEIEEKSKWSKFVAKRKVYRTVFDILLKKYVCLNAYVDHEERSFYYNSFTVYGKHKRLLGKRELKKFDVKNNTI